MTPKQLKCIDLLAKAEQPQQEIAQQLSINPSTISHWKKDPVFMQAVVDRAKELIKESIPEVYRALTSRSKTGSDRHIKILLDHLEKLEEAKIKATQTVIQFTWKPNGTTGA